MVKYKSNELNTIFHALADPTRRRILLLVAKRERQATDLANRFHMSFPAVSKHVKVLEHARFVRRKIEGRVHWISFEAKTAKKAMDWLKFYEAFWNEKLDNLEDLFNKKRGDKS